ncbi:MAG: PQQ-dependent sugar dehydrogenase [Planctomycetota bacterium]|nr:PQQ-dependent sugar dehydrogenase [Planctomycetota bacterium]
MRRIGSTARAALTALCALASTSVAFAQASTHALRFSGTGANQLDRLRFRIDDDQPGPDASAPCDLGSFEFSFEFWIKGNLADNPTTTGAGDQSRSDRSWREGNIVIDRGIFAGSEREFGVSIAGGHVRFGTGRGDGANQDPTPNTLEGSTNVLDGAWHHVVVSRALPNGFKIIVVDGVLDIASPPNVSNADLSYPNDGLALQAHPYDSWLVIGADKFDTVPGQRAFKGVIDELRAWRFRRTPAAINADFMRVIPPDTPGLVASWRFEEGTGTIVHDLSAVVSPNGELVAGLLGNGEWTSYAIDPASCAPIVSTSLPQGFERQLIAGGFVEPTTLVLLPDGRIFVGERTGAIRVVQNGNLLGTPLVQLPTNVNLAERGLLGLVLDPRFAENGWIYAFYTTQAARDRVSRFTLEGDSLKVASEFVVWEHTAVSSAIHHGGALVFDAEGYLYISVGDQGDSTTSQPLTNYGGKILRLNPDGSVPSDNPFVQVPGALPEIYASGFRNPFRMHWDADRKLMWVGNVGGNQPNSWEELDVLESGANYGWPDEEGPNCWTGQCANFTPARHRWRHDDPAYAPTQPGSAIVAGPVCTSSVFPPEYRGNVFVADYANAWIRRLVLDGSGQVVADPMFVPAPDAGPVVDMKFGADGALYYVSWGLPWLPPVEGSRLWKIVYTNSTNVAPIAVSKMTQRGASVPLHVFFDGSASSDPDGGPGALTHHWDFGDGATATQPRLRHIFANRGAYDVVLTVSDGASSRSAAPLRVVVGNAPVVTIASPAPNSRYLAGQTITFSGTANDVEDGPLLASALSWQVLLVHGLHEHPFLGPINGVAGASFVVPTTGHEPADTHYSIVLTARDSDGIESTRTVAIFPVVTNVSFHTLPEGIPLSIDAESRGTPFLTPSLAGFQHHLVAPLIATIAGQPYVFVQWSNGATSPTIDWPAPAQGGMLRAFYRLPPP